MPKFNVLVSENTSATIEVEAENENQAQQIVQKQIDDGILDGMTMAESGGYTIEDVQEAGK